MTRRASSDPACILPHFVSHPPDRSEKAPSEGLRSTREGPRAVYCVRVHAPEDLTSTGGLPTASGRVTLIARRIGVLSILVSVWDSRMTAQPGSRHQQRSLSGASRAWTAPTPRPQRGQPHVVGPLGGLPNTTASAVVDYLGSKLASCLMTRTCGFRTRILGQAPRRSRL